MNIKKIFIFSFLLILVLWFCSALFRTFYNFSKVPSDSKLLQISDDKKRISTYGTFFNFCKFIKNKTPENSKLLFLSSSGKAFYVCRYELYPRQLFYIINPKQISSKSEYDYLIIYRNLDASLNENNSEKWDLNDTNYKYKYEDKDGGNGGIVQL